MIDTNFKKARFSLDAYEGEMFEGYTRGETWNGFECPYFLRENAERIIEVFSSRQTAFYDEMADCFVFVSEDNSDEDEAERFSALEVAGIGRIYPIGAFVWAWDKVEIATL